MFQAAVQAAEPPAGVSVALLVVLLLFDDGCLLVMSFCVSHRSRTDVVAVTPWLAPVIWEGTFDPLLLDSIYRPQNISIAATVFAVGK